MKTKGKTLFALFLCLCLLLGGVSPALAAAAGAPDGEAAEIAVETPPANAATAAPQRFLGYFMQVFAKCLNLLSNFVINTLAGGTLSTLIPDSRAVGRLESFDLNAYGNFYPGHETFLHAPARGAVWRLGYGRASVLPANLAEKGYAKGAYLPDVFCKEMYLNDEGEPEDLCARAVALDDGSGRGVTLFISVDAMGLANATVRKIRAGLADLAAAYGIVSLNVSCTHIHTGIDSQGAWNRPVVTGVSNIFRSEPVTGVDAAFLDALIAGARESAAMALGNLRPGTLRYSTLDISDYVWDRTAPICLDPTLYKLEFTPADGARPTVLATFGCHPESASYDWDQAVDENGKKGLDKKLSADFPYYMERVANAVGYNFIFIQGNVCTVTSGRSLSNDGLDTDAHSTAVRYGYELGYITMGMNLTQPARRALNAAAGDKLGVEAHAGEEDYTVWYEDLPTVAAREVAPLLNIAHRQFVCPVDNKVMAIIAKNAVAENLVLRDWLGRFYTVTEVGYLELGDAFKAYLSPGETFTELLKGGSGLAGFPYPAIREKLGEDTIVFDLMNDAAGYVANDANFAMVGVQYNENTGGLDGDTWCIISYGRRAGSTFIGNLYALADEKRPVIH